MGESIHLFGTVFNCIRKPSTMSAENLIKFFQKIDDDNSGFITPDELNSLFAKFDKDGSGKLDQAEFAAGMADSLGASAEQSAKAFKGLDKDGSGDLTLEECADLFKGMDKDGNGSISQDEFIAFWVALLK